VYLCGRTQKRAHVAIDFVFEILGSYLGPEPFTQYEVFCDFPRLGLGLGDFSLHPLRLLITDHFVSDTV
jgi:hypothetical protein